MGASKRLYEDEQERMIIEVPASYYKEHFGFFKYPKTRHIKTIVTADEQMFQNDEHHSQLVKAYSKAKADLDNYKFKKRHQ